MRQFKRAADIKAGMIGYGQSFRVGHHHISEIKQAGMQAVAVADPVKSCRDQAEKDFPGIQTYKSVDEMLKKSDINLAAVLTPHNSHADLAIRCLRAGRHVVCEKPFAITTAECDAMIREAKKRKLMLSTYHNRHWDGCILEATRLIRRGVIGKVIRAEAHMGGYRCPGAAWRSSKSISGGILYDWGAHLLEYSLQVIKSDIVEVMGHAATGFWAPKTPWKKDTIEDEGFAIVRFKNGAWLTLCISHIDSNPKPGIIEFTGTKGSYIMDHQAYTIVRHDGQDTITTKGRNRRNEGWRFYKNIANHLTKGTKLVITAEWARRPIHILDLAGQSAKRGKALAAKYS